MEPTFGSAARMCERPSRRLRLAGASRPAHRSVGTDVPLGFAVNESNLSL